MSDRAYYIWLACGLALTCASFFTFGYLIGVNS